MQIKTDKKKNFLFLFFFIFKISTKRERRSKSHKSDVRKKRQMHKENTGETGMEAKIPQLPRLWN